MGFNITGVTRILIIMNVIVYFGSTILPAEESTISLWLAVHYPASEFFKPVQLITHMFMHGSLQHLFFNMFGLYMFGPPLEYVLGPKRFLTYYLGAGFGALALDFAVKYGMLHFGNVSDYDASAIINTPMVGASGALFGLLAGYAMFFPNNVLQLLFPPIPIKAKYFVLIYAAIELFLGISGRQANVAHFAHLGGALFGFLCILYWRKTGTIGKY